jgi:arylsulfatase A-like enzyme
MLPTRALRTGLALSLIGACLVVPRLVSAQAKGTTGAGRASLLLITVDTLRPDALGWVSGRQETAAIDRLASEGFAFAAAVAPAPLTLPSHAAMLTARTPARVGIRDNGHVLGAGVGTLAEALKRAGYNTAAFVSGYPLAAAFGLDRGFDVYDDRLSAGREGDLERPAAATTAAAVAWLRAARAPWFAWVHYYDPHYPYEPPGAFTRPGPRGAYDGEVAYVDHAIAELRRGLERLKPGPVLTVFAADHGESLGEHGEGTHGFFIYDSTVLVPLIFHFPGRVAPGRSALAARLLDLAPTALDLMGRPPLAEAEGVSLAPTLAGRAQAIPPAYIETRQPWSSYGWSPLEAVRRDGWKLIQAPRPELYDLKQDPAEARNVIDRHAATARELAGVLDRTKPGQARPRGTMDPGVAERPRSL